MKDKYLNKKTSKNKNDNRLFENLNNVIAEQNEKNAIIQGDRTLSYKELDYAVEHLAQNLLEEFGQEIPQIIPIMAERSIEFIVAALACWKVGAGYLPIATATPVDRIKFILSDSQCPLVLVNSNVVLDELPGTTVRWQINTATVATHPFVINCKQQLAYVIYTSGTTGSPKGCAVGFESLSPIASAFSEHFELDVESRITVVANVAFDAAVIEIWPGLSCGASLYIVDHSTTLHPKLLVDFYTQHQISFSWLPTPIAEILMKEDELVLPASLKTIETAGQRLTVRPPEHWHVKIENSYGPTETTVIATSSMVSPVNSELPELQEISDLPKLPDIGSPLPGIECHILDNALQPVAQGKSGELFIAGIGVTRGYINRPQLNKEKFRVLSFADGRNIRAYATGDICRLNGNGQLEFIDRKDDQLKLNGYRIEIGEIEYRLANCEGITQAAVECKAVAGQPCLIGYYSIGSDAQFDNVPRTGSAPEIIDIPNIKHSILATLLAKFLPDYMVPTYFVELVRLPLTVNGKVDKKALPLPDVITAQVIDDTLTNEQQRYLTLFNRYVIMPLGWHDDFFAAGGNSISAIRLVSAIYTHFSMVVPFKVIFEQRSPSAIWQKLKQTRFSGTVISPRGEGFAKVAPLSSSQRSVWFLAGMDPEDRAYHAKAFVRLYGDVNREAVIYGIQTVVDRHEIYRSTFADPDDIEFNDVEGEIFERNAGGVQVIHSSHKIELKEVDYSQLAPDLAESKLSELVHQSLNQAFQLDKLPLARWALVKMSDQESVLLHIEHHLVHDGWSYNLFLADFIKAYRQFGKNNIEATNLPVQYADFSVKQVEWLKSAEAQRQIEYWVEQLQGAPELLNLPHDGVGINDPRAGKTIRMKLPRTTWRKVESFTNKRGETPFSFMLAVLNFVFSRYSGDKDICIGSAFANRNWVGADEIIGMMINTVVLRTRLTSDLTVEALLSQCFKTAVAAQNNQELPFEHVVNAVNPERQPGINPLFQVFLGFHDSPMPAFELPGITGCKVLEAIDSQAAKFDLSVILIPRADQEGEDNPIHVLWEFKRSVFSDWFIEQLMHGFLFVVDRFLSRPEVKLSSLEFETGSLQGNTQPVTQVPVIHRILQQAEKTPTHCAIQCQQQRLTYAQLALAIRKKAAILCDQGIVPGDKVGICLERNIELVVWFLAVQAAGATTIPLDPTYPRERLKYIVEDSRVKAVISEKAHEYPCLYICSLQDDATMSDSSAQTDPCFELPALDMNSIMYVIYTSGSTGKPKGVAISQHAFSNLFDAITEAFPLTEKNRWLAVTSCSFDISTVELFLPLLQGAAVLLATTEQTRDPKLLLDLMTNHTVSHFQATPTTWRSLVEYGWSINRPITGLCAGEPLDTGLASSLIDNGVKLFNLYGPTETTVYSCMQPITTQNMQRITLGKAINNTRIYLLDDEQNPVPEGAVGKLWIGGEGLASGYLHNEKLTGERFIAVNGNSAKLRYNTGDLAALNELGELVFHGRVDHQVKLGGYRIELGEIEQVLRQYENVNDVVVVTQILGESEQLVAFVVFEKTVFANSNDEIVNIDDTGIDKLKQYGSKYLPHYMVPGHIVALDKLPLTPNGKINRHALPLAVDRVKVSHLAKTPTEIVLVEIYGQLLGIQQVDIGASFFKLGGQSLLAMRLVTRIEKAFSVPLKVADFLALNSITHVAAYIDSVTDDGSDDEILEEISI